MSALGCGKHLAGLPSWAYLAYPELRSQELKWTSKLKQNGHLTSDMTWLQSSGTLLTCSVLLLMAIASFRWEGSADWDLPSAHKLPSPSNCRPDPGLNQAMQKNWGITSTGPSMCSSEWISVHRKDQTAGRLLVCM